MKIIVQKFGGSSVADAAKLASVAKCVARRKAEGFALVVVVSAMGKTTDALFKQALEIDSEPPQRELDMLVTAGERISMTLLTMAIQKLGIEAISFTGSQSGIITENRHQGARILEIRPSRIIDALESGESRYRSGLSRRQSRARGDHSGTRWVRYIRRSNGGST